MIDHAILAALRVSDRNPAAIAALALIELSIAEPPILGSIEKLGELIDNWGLTLRGVGAADVEHLKNELKSCSGSPDALTPTLKQAS
jgi:hypothetical protein